MFSDNEDFADVDDEAELNLESKNVNASPTTEIIAPISVVNLNKTLQPTYTQIRNNLITTSMFVLF